MEKSKHNIRSVPVNPSHCPKVTEGWYSEVKQVMHHPCALEFDLAHPVHEALTSSGTGNRASQRQSETSSYFSEMIY